MKNIKKILLILLLFLSLIIVGCNNNVNYDNVKIKLDETITEFKEAYDINNITEDITFITIDEENYYYIWKSSNQDVITNNGLVNRQLEDVEVIITVKIFYKEIYFTDSFTCVVLKIESDGYTYDVENTQSFLTIYELNTVDENNEYNDYLSVIAYIYYFKKLPNNYLTKSQAKKLGWKGSGNVWANDSLKGKNIGGDTFNNYEQILPIANDNTYIELDVNCSNGSRGKYRIVYNRYTFDIYYTDDHYNSFTYMIGVLK